MFFVSIETRQKIDFAILKSLAPNVSLPADPSNADLIGLGYVRFVPTARPDPGPFADVEEIDPAADGTQQWQVTEWPAEAARAAMRARVNAIRDRKETEGFAFAGKLFESDERSVARISNAALTAQSLLATGQPFSVDWVAADNSVMTLDGPAMLGMQGALTAHAGILHGHARALKAQIDAAATMAAIAAIDINAGWPA